MIPRLVAIDGPLRGTAFPLASLPFTIGRKPDNCISTAELSVSRQHCSIHSAGGRFVLCDHDSQNGTFWNGIPIRERVLSHGDQIAVGASVFVFLFDGVEAPSPAPTLQHRIIGESPAIRNVLEFVARVAPLDSTVLITGQKGAGKKCIAQALHDNGPRAQRPFFAANCAAVSEAFLESDLFGQEADALHGVPAARPGKVELAEGGTLFLDEIGELPPALQGRLLRLLQENRFERTGGTQTLTANVRVLASTSRDLAAAAQNAAFRPDLYFRLCVLSVALPPLRQRSQDIALLANYFRVQQSTRQQRRVLGITAAAHDCLLHYGWPGNVSELQSAIASAVAVGCTEGILPEDLPDSVLPGVDAPADALPRFNQVLIETKRELILKAYQQARGSHVHAASQLGLHPESLLRLVRSLGLEAAIRSLNGAGSQSGTS